MTEAEIDNTPVPTPPASQKPAWLLPLITGVVGMILGGLIVGIGGIVATGLSEAGEAASRATVFADALEACDLKDDTNSEIADDGSTLVVASRGEEDSAGLNYDEITCILDELKIPRAVMSHFEQTTSMDGRQTESWDEFTLSWSYHPDRGADYVVTIEQPN